MRLLKELNIKIKKHYKKIELLKINKQEMHFATHGQAYLTQTENCI